VSASAAAVDIHTRGFNLVIPVRMSLRLTGDDKGDPQNPHLLAPIRKEIVRLSREREREIKSRNCADPSRKLHPPNPPHSPDFIPSDTRDSLREISQKNPQIHGKA
jgi:hypothetical protein